MKWKNLIIIGLVAVLTVGCTNQGITQTPTETTLASTDVKPGNFQPAEHQTQGQVTLVEQAKKSYLEFDKNFKTAQGPDLYVILYRSETPPKSGIQEKDYVSIARLQKISGNQRYLLPKNLQLKEFKYVAIWCKQFNVTFGYAIL